MSEIISKAMNSTLGTNKFKAFDELLLDSKSLIPGDDVVIPFNDNAYSSYWYINDTVIKKTETEIVKFTMPLSGRIKLRYDMTTDNKDYVSCLYIYVNGTMQTTENTWSTSSGDTPAELIISANRGDVITIKALSSKSWTDDGVTTYNTRLYLYDIRYKVVDSPSVSMTKSV